ncbi:cell envelope integrity protein TolA [Aliiglaciecola sp. 2_MG-2023]|uniref:cell envelope integrity protein TolA n=1 Tax=unclassified Aliiglaciecola TaxID=2593648 RepID=UPI0026E3AF5D|nr:MULTISPECIES: cell envelope integrity protein TolA [unclassified Aliiglaciecola]MDO6709458.1 cell envelope integrity protein TolA [Aliiglaciecola sp. 2_MG-2023]MDO6750606.1 cell envelope integrity protein TolA [Aliiglaciecola sp. 1_MG-2023]
MYKFSPIFISIALHIILGGLLALSVDFHSPPKQIELNTANFTPIEATVVDQKAVNDQLKRIEQKKQAEKQKELQKIRDEQRRKAEAEQRKRDIAAKEKKRKEDAKRQKQAAAEAKEKKRLAEEKAREEEQQKKQRELERRAAEERERKAREKRANEERAKKEAERKKREEAELREQERLMQEQLEMEQSSRNQQRQRQVLSETEKYTALINAKIDQNTYKDDSMKGKSCRINIRLSSSGFVIQIRTLGGDKVVCVAGEQAIRRAGELPMSSDPQVYNNLKDITINFGF